ncbi:MAG TPA: Zn-dependent alcohol dehydrogenase [Acidimicrobiales bacterium]|nr:Zn-dependent alcohol dehydrogenase [Acidimicrobiales bacterium]
MASESGRETVELVDDLEVGEPGPGEIELSVRAAGICHSDLSGMNGTILQRFPFVPGHEGAGEVTAVGPGVTGVEEGDHVIVAWTPPCGTCKACLRGQPNLCVDIFFAMQGRPSFRRAGEGVFGFAGTGTWAERMVLPEQAVVVIPRDVPFDIAALIGCGVTTGVGAAVNTARVAVGASVVVFGCGGVGISAIQGARLCGAAEIVAVDTVARKLDDARRFGATGAVAPDDLPAALVEVTGGEGFDYAFECIGTAPTFRAAWDATRRGGTTVIVGAGRGDATLSLNGFELFFSEKALLGSYYGSADVRTEFHRLIRLWRAGRLDLDGMVSARLELSQINDGLGALKRGEVIRQVVTL